MSHRHWLKFGVQRTLHSIPSSCAHDVVCLILRDSPFYFLLSTFSLSSFSFIWSSASSSTMWKTNTLRTSANEDLGTFAEYDPLTHPTSSGVSPWIRLGKFMHQLFVYDSCLLLSRHSCLILAGASERGDGLRTRRISEIVFPRHGCPVCGGRRPLPSAGCRVVAVLVVVSD